MSVIATAVRHLMAAGITGEDLVAAIADMEAALPRDAVADKRRAYDRERKRAEKAAATGIPVESAESAETPSLSPSPLPSPHTPQPTPRPHTHPDNTTRARKGHRLPVDWVPDLVSGELAKRVELWPPGALESELERFRDWAASAPGQKGLKTDWQAAWRNWLRRADDEGKHSNGHHRGTGQARNGRGHQDKRDGFARALDRRLGLDDDQGPNWGRDAGEGGGYRQLPAARPGAV